MNVIIHVINILLGGEILCYFLYCQKIISVFCSSILIIFWVVNFLLEPRNMVENEEIDNVTVIFLIVVLKV